jgi:hypothetical protein
MLAGMSQRWAPVPGPEALASAGEPVRVLTAGRVIYALGPEATVFVVEAGDRPGDSAVQTADDVTLRAPFPDDVSEALRARDQTIIGYVRLADDCVPLGRLRVSSVNAHECHLFLTDRLPFDVLDLVRPVTPATDAAGLDWLALLPTDPVAALRAFVATWYADLPPLDGPGEFGALPAPLASFHAAAAGRREVLGGFNRVYPFAEIPPPPTGGGPMAFGAEGRGGFQLTIDPTEPDPPVTYTDLGHGPVVEREPLSGFLMQSALLDAAITSPFTGFAAADRLQVERLMAFLTPVPLQPLRYPNDPTRLYAGPGVVAAIGDAAGSYEIYLGARSRAALLPMRDAGVHWQYFAG